MKKIYVICIILLFIQTGFTFSQETSSWKSFPGAFNEHVRQNYASASAAWSIKDFNIARAEYEKVLAIANAPAQYRSYARLRIAQSFMVENNLTAARAEYEKIKANVQYPEVHRYEAMECIKEIDRLAKGLPARDTMASRTIIKTVNGFSAEFYISPDGRDANPGTSKKPFATLEKARDAIRELKTKGLPGPVAVNLLPGIYRLKESFMLSSEDSGTPETPIVFRAQRKGDAVLYGGKKLVGFKIVTNPVILNRLPEEAKGKVYQCDLKKQGIKDYGILIERGYGVLNPPPTLELFFNSHPMTPARWPNKGFVNGVKVIEPGSIKEKKPSVFEYHDSRHSRWTKAKDGWLYGYFSYGWADRTLRIMSIDSTSKTITCGIDTMRHESYFNNGKIRYFAFNMLEEMDMPEEWYLDREDGILYFYPPSDPDLATIEIGMLTVPMIQMSNVSDIRFEGLVFDLSRVSCMSIENSENCLIAGCTIKRFAASGIKINEGRNNGIFGCDIYSLGRGCTEVSGGNRTTLTPSGHFIENCRMYSFGRIDHTYVPGVELKGVGIRVRHNLFYDSPSSVVRIFGNDHLIEYNEVHDVLLESEDQGAMTLFGDPTFRGIIFRFNLFSNIGYGFAGGPSGRAGIRLDDAISGMIIYSNIFFNASQAFGGININGGRDNIIDNNIFVDCNKGITGRYNPRNKVWTSLASEKNTYNYLYFMSDLYISRNMNDLYLSRYPDLNHIYKQPADNFVWRTVFWNTGPPFSDSEKVRIDDFDIMEIAEYSTKESPFIDPGKDNYSLRAEAPFFENIGFREIPAEEIGLYNDFYRASPLKK